MSRHATRQPRTILTSAGIGAAAVLLAAAATAPAYAGEHADSSGPDDNGNHYGQSQDHGKGPGQDHGNNGRHGSGTAGDRNSVDGSAAPTGHNPPGNNGTVKIHDDYGDTAHHNVPHVDCDFAVAFWGFDLNQNLDVSFAGQAPTGKDTLLTVTGAPTSITSPDAAGGGQDYDGELQFRADQLNLASLGDPHPKQGYHIKLTVNTYEPGGHKYKVFWLQPCTTPAVTGTAVAPTSASQDVDESPGNEESSSAGEANGAAVAAGATSANADIPTTVLGRSITRPGQAASPAAASLPFTGTEIGGMAAVATAALGFGTAMTVAGRRRRHARRVSAS